MTTSSMQFQQTTQASIKNLKLQYLVKSMATSFMQFQQTTQASIKNLKLQVSQLAIEMSEMRA